MTTSIEKNPSGSIITLRPATMDDRQMVFHWLVISDISTAMFGPPDYPEVPAPGWDEFIEDYTDNYFNGSQPLMGRSFIILENQEAVGHINYNEIHPEDQSTELDIWLANSAYTGKGIGSEALELLCEYLHQNFNCRQFYLGPSRRNARAISAYHKAGFRETTDIPGWFVPDYTDVVLMVKRLNQL